MAKKKTEISEEIVTDEIVSEEVTPEVTPEEDDIPIFKNPVRLQQFLKSKEVYLSSLDQREADELDRMINIEQKNIDKEVRKELRKDSLSKEIADLELIENGEVKVTLEDGTEEIKKITLLQRIKLGRLRRNISLLLSVLLFAIISFNSSFAADTQKITSVADAKHTEWIETATITSANGYTKGFKYMGDFNRMRVDVVSSSFGTITGFSLIQYTANKTKVVSTTACTAGTWISNLDMENMEVVFTATSSTSNQTAIINYTFERESFVGGSSSASGALRVSLIEVLVGNVVVVPLTTASTWVSASIGTGSTGFIIKTPLDIYVGATGGTSNVFSVDADSLQRKFACTSTTIWLYSKSGTNNIELQGIQ